MNFQIPSGNFTNPHDLLTYIFEPCNSDKKIVLVKHKRYRPNGEFVSEGVMSLEELRKQFAFGSFIPVV